MAKPRSSSSKRDREFQKRERDRKKREKAEVKRQRRENKEGTAVPTVTDDAPAAEVDVPSSVQPDAPPSPPEESEAGPDTGVGHSIGHT